MIIYADILIVLNFIVDYFLLRLTSHFAAVVTPLWRLLCGAAAGAVFSLYIFIPEAPAVIEAVIKIIMCLAITIITFGYKSAKRFFRSAVIFVAVTVGYGGAMAAIWFLFKPSGMIINNSVVYFNISPVFLIIFSVAGYLVSAILNKLLERPAAQKDCCSVEITALGGTVKTDALIDSGNAAEDILGRGEVIIVDKKIASDLFGSIYGTDDLNSRYRALPLKTVSGSEILDGYRCDSATVITSGKSTLLTRPIIAVSKTPLGGDFGAIINPKTID